MHKITIYVGVLRIRRAIFVPSQWFSTTSLHSVSLSTKRISVRSWKETRFGAKGELVSIRCEAAGYPVAKDSERLREDPGLRLEPEDSFCEGGRTLTTENAGLREIFSCFTNLS